MLNSIEDKNIQRLHFPKGQFPGLNDVIIIMAVYEALKTGKKVKLS